MVSLEMKFRRINGSNFERERVVLNLNLIQGHLLLVQR